MGISDTQAADGVSIDTDNNLTLTYNADGNVDYMETISSGKTYRQTFLYDGAKRLISISKWEPQS